LKNSCVLSPTLIAGRHMEGEKKKRRIGEKKGGRKGGGLALFHELSVGDVKQRKEQREEGDPKRRGEKRK